MTTISPRRRKSQLPYSTVALLFLLALIVVASALWRKQLTSIFWTIVSPAVVLRNSIDHNESTRLRADLASTTAALADRDELYRENLMLKAQFGRDAGAHTVLASVLMYPPGTPYDTLLIDAGAENGVTSGALVSAGGNLYIGTITDVYRTTSRVSLFSAPGSSYNALIMLSSQPGKSIPVALEGEGAGSMSAQVPASSVVTVGDSIIVPGIATAFAGTVSHIEKSPSDSFETVFTQLPINLFSIPYVEVRMAL